MRLRFWLCGCVDKAWRWIWIRHDETVRLGMRAAQVVCIHGSRDGVLRDAIVLCRSATVDVDVDGDRDLLSQGAPERLKAMDRGSRGGFEGHCKRCIHEDEDFAPF